MKWRPSTEIWTKKSPKRVTLSDFHVKMLLILSYFLYLNVIDGGYARTISSWLSLLVLESQVSFQKIALSTLLVFLSFREHISEYQVSSGGKVGGWGSKLEDVRNEAIILNWYSFAWNDPWSCSAYAVIADSSAVVGEINFECFFVLFSFLSPGTLLRPLLAFIHSLLGFRYLKSRHL